MTDKIRLWHKRYNPIHKNDGQQESLTLDAGDYKQNLLLKRRPIFFVTQNRETHNIAAKLELISWKNLSKNRNWRYLSHKIKKLKQEQRAD